MPPPRPLPPPLPRPPPPPLPRDSLRRALLDMVISTDNSSWSSPPHDLPEQDARSSELLTPDHEKDARSSEVLTDPDNQKVHDTTGSILPQSSDASSRSALAEQQSQITVPNKNAARDPAVQSSADSSSSNALAEQHSQITVPNKDAAGVPDVQSSADSSSSNALAEKHSQITVLKKDAAGVPDVQSSADSSSSSALAEQQSQIAVPSKDAAGVPDVQSSAASSSSSSLTEQHSQITVPNNGAAGDLAVQSSSSSTSVRPNKFPDMMAVQMGLLRALFDPDQEVASKVFHQSPDAVKNHYARDVELAYTVGRVDPIFNLASGLESRDSVFGSLLHRIKFPGEQPIRIINLKGQVPALSVHPVGSRFITKKLDIATTGEIVLLYNEITPEVPRLVYNVFANSAIMKLLDHGPEPYRNRLVRNLIGHVLALSVHQYGHLVIEKAFEIGHIDHQIEIAKELNTNLQRCVRDQHGNHVVQKCMECVPEQYIHFIYRSIRGKAKTIASHQYGCRIIQKVLDFCKDPPLLYPIAAEIVENVDELSADKFGTYVVQHMVQNGGPSDRQTILMKFVGRFVELSHQKYSANVIEKLLMYGSYQDRKIIITEFLCAGDGQTADHLVSMMIHETATYVVQKMIDAADEWEFSVFAEAVRRNADTLNKNALGKRLVTHVNNLLKRTPTFFAAPPPPPPPQPHFG
ncbi:hypothetical protein BRADI_4g09132v3 [Brachypodium distachyon]|uniref:PUM-HD domain-containing protein n=1 Tax=Brachypodium distachyon TaxID=15368 RepID=A0A2K2CLG9_BRADI|nr:hypothetical protein BRADI_4g09132v3 [Brachypodium distachyon]